MAINDSGLARFFLSGNFRIELSSGVDVTPRSAKAQALLALLATAQNGARSRSWLQSRLWSDRAPEQASGSLRQCILQIRQSLSDVPGLIEATRQKVSLDLSKVTLITNEEDEFLEGMDVGDEAFEEWLRSSRISAQCKVASPTIEPRYAQPLSNATIIAINISSNGADWTEWLSIVLADTLALSLRETFSLKVVIGEAVESHENVWNVSIDTTHFSPAKLGVRMALVHFASGVNVWAGNRVIEIEGAPPAEHPELFQLCNQLIESIGDALYHQDQGSVDVCPDALCRQGIRELFKMRPSSVKTADELFEKAFALNSRGVYLAWRAQAKTITRIERYAADDDALLEEAEMLCRKAIELEPNNSLVLATVANTYGHVFRNHKKSLFLANRSVLLNPSNPMGWWAMSSANMYVGKENVSLDYSIKGDLLALTSPHRFWWDLQIFLAALMKGRLPEAQHFAEQCYAQNPDFRPPMRYLIALYSNNGRDDDATKMAEQLRVLEPDFSIERLVKDQSYPASLLHRDNGLNLDRLLALV